MTMLKLVKGVITAAAAGSVIYLLAGSSRQSRRRICKGASMTMSGISDALDDCRK